MKINEKALEKKRQNKARIASHILHRKQISKPELAIELGLSMPTVLQNVKELQEAGIVEEVGEYESTGGRKAKALSVVKNVRYAAGVDITANHISVVIIDLKGDMVHSRRFIMRTWRRNWSSSWMRAGWIKRKYWEWAFHCRVLWIGKTAG